jgi:FG-GAP-like repeat
MTFDPRARRLAPLTFLATVATAAMASAQTYQNTPSQIPQGNPFNNSYTEGVDFADIDGDGDYDCGNADGGDCCNDQPRIWVNLGGLQAGTIGFFQDETSTRFPAVLADGRDLDFVDVDADGDQDLYFSNTSQISQQSNRFFVNMGGAQAGTPGFFQDQTAAHWINLGVNNGSTTFSSIAATQVLGSGGFIDWSCDCVFGDLNNDGSIDLVHSTYGGSFSDDVPTRLFLNNGSGGYEEFNPSHVQLAGPTIAGGTPGLWCEGVHTSNTLNSTGAQCDIAATPLGVEIGDTDADFDIDIVHGARDEVPRVFQGRLQENGGTLGYRDITGNALTTKPGGTGHYEQEIGDFDNDGDLDLYGLNWGAGFADIVSFNNGGGMFGAAITLSGSSSDDNEGEFVDYDNDGDLDLMIANFSGQDRLYRNDGAPNWTFTNVTSTQMPFDNQTGLQVDTVDIDNDGDYDALVGNDGGQPNWLLKNVSQIADTRAPFLPHIEQAPNRSPSATPTAIRVQVHDNAAWNVTQFNTTTLEYRVNGGPVQTAPMRYAGGNLFRGIIPGNLTGLITYQAKSKDRSNNTGASQVLGYQSGTTPPSVFCTSKPSSIAGCVPTLTGPDTSVSKGAGAGSYTLAAFPVPGGAGKPGILIYTRLGQSAPVNTAFGFLCLNSFARLGAFPAAPGGTTGVCDGVYFWDFGNIVNVTPEILVSDTLHTQAWYRDPPNPGTANFTQGVGGLTVLP